MNKQEIPVSGGPASFGGLPDTEIIARILKGEKELYALIVRRYNQRLYRIGMSIMKDELQVEDIMQVTYINAYENLGRFAFNAALSTWLTKILINECYLRLKQRKKSVTFSNELMGENLFGKNTEAPKTPIMELMNNELREILEKSILQLPEKYRTVFIMREIEGLNIAETKECLDISEVNVKVRLNRAKSLLKEMLGTYYKNDQVLHFHLSRCDRMVALVMEGLTFYPSV